MRNHLSENNLDVILVKLLYYVIRSNKYNPFFSVQLFRELFFTGFKVASQWVLAAAPVHSHDSIYDHSSFTAIG